MEIKDIISSGLLELYVTGSTSKEETLQVEQWAEQYPEVRREIEELQNVMEAYALAEAIQPEEALKEKIFARIQPDNSVKEKIFSRITTQEPSPVITEKPGKAKVYSIPFYYKWAVAAGIILLIGSIILNYTFYNRYRTASNDLELAQDKLYEQQQLVKEIDDQMRVVKDKNSIPVVLSGTEKSPDALAKIYWVKNNGEVWVDPTNLPQAPTGMQYQLWAIVDGKPVDAGMITTEKGVFYFQKMKSFGKAQAFAITLETKGGNPTPKGDMIVHAKI